MGNQHATRHHLSTKEIDKYTKPTGYVFRFTSILYQLIYIFDVKFHVINHSLYQSCPWENKAARKLILERKIAPRYPGSDIQCSDSYECPICFMVCTFCSFGFARQTNVGVEWYSIIRAYWIKVIVVNNPFAQVNIKDDIKGGLKDKAFNLLSWIL